MEQDGEELPAPTPITELHLADNEVPVLIEVFMPPVREKINSRFVKKTLSLPAWLAAKADEDGVNCSRIFQVALMNYLHVNDENRASQKLKNRPFAKRDGTGRNTRQCASFGNSEEIQLNQ